MGKAGIYYKRKRAEEGIYLMLLGYIILMILFCEISSILRNTVKI